MATGAFKGQGTQLQRAGVTVAEIINIDGPDGKAEFDDATNMDSTGNFKEWIPTLLDSGELSFTGNFVGASNVSQAQLISDFNNFTLSAWTVLFPGGKELVGTLQKVKIHSFSSQTLLGELMTSPLLISSC